jgi:ABC-type lipoprotein release transport system permease subunit
MNLGLVCWRSVVRRSWRQAIVLSLVGGLLGAVALGALAGARRTASAYDRYLRAISASDVFVNIPGTLPGLPVTRPFALISALPGVAASASFAGLNAVPVVHGHPDGSFLTTGLTGSIDGAYFRQDRVVPLAGKLPAPDSTTGIVLAPRIAQLFGVGVGGRVTYEFLPDGPGDTTRPLLRSYTVAAIGETPPVLVDQVDQGQAAILPPGATRQVLARYYAYGFVGLRLDRGVAGIPELQRHLATLAAATQQEINRATAKPGSGLTFGVERIDLIRGHVKQAIRPEAVALTIFGLIAAVAMLVLVFQGLFQLVSRNTPDAGTLRALGANRRQAIGVTCLAGLIPVAGITALAGAVAVALSPLAPVGPVRHYDPGIGVHADPLVLGVGLPAIFVLVLGALVVVARRSTRRAATPGRTPAGRRSVLMAGLPPAALIGVRNAVARGSGQRSAPILSTLGGSIVAVTAMVAAVVFSVSLTNLTSHPARFGWNWDVLVQAESGYGSFNPGVMSRLVGGQPSVAGWSELAFTQLSVDGRDVPVVGLRRHTGDVVPPTTSGQPLSGTGQVELGAETLAELGKKVGDTVSVGSPPYARRLTITGTVTLPSIGVAETDHVSLGRGALLPEATLLAAVGVTGGPQSATISQPVFPSTAVIDLTPGTTGPQRAALVHRIVAANPDGTPGGTYELPPQLASEVYNAQQLGRQPVALAVGLAVASMLSLAMTVLSLVRRRRREFALLKTLGMTRRQIRAVIAWQTSVTLLIAVAAGLTLGIVLGRLAWRDFAGSIGVVPVSVVPVLLLAAGLAALVLTGNLLASWPATIAARTRAALILKAE